jgi:hypothetical protein
VQRFQQPVHDEAAQLRATVVARHQQHRLAGGHDGAQRRRAAGFVEQRRRERHLRAGLLHDARLRGRGQRDRLRDRAPAREHECERARE